MLLNSIHLLQIRLICSKPQSQGTIAIRNSKCMSPLHVLPVKFEYPVQVGLPPEAAEATWPSLSEELTSDSYSNVVRVVICDKVT